MFKQNAQAAEAKGPKQKQGSPKGEGKKEEAPKKPKINPEEVVPLKLVLKAEPPIIGVFYATKSDPKKKHIYNILLNNLLELGDSADITEIIYKEHHRVLNPEKIPPEQVQVMIDRLLDYYMQGEDEEEYEMYEEGEEPIDEEQYRRMMAAAQNRGIFMTNQEEFEESGGLENIDELNQEQLNQLYKQKVSTKMPVPVNKGQGAKAGAGAAAGRKKDDLNSSF